MNNNAKNLNKSDNNNFNKNKSYFNNNIDFNKNLNNNNKNIKIIQIIIPLQMKILQWMKK